MKIQKAKKHMSPQGRRSTRSAGVTDIAGYLRRAPKSLEQDDILNSE